MELFLNEIVFFVSGHSRAILNSTQTLRECYWKWLTIINFKLSATIQIPSIKTFKNLD